MAREILIHVEKERHESVELAECVTCGCNVPLFRFFIQHGDTHALTDPPTLACSNACFWEWWEG